MKNKISTLLFILCLFSSGLSQDLQFSVSADRTSATVGEQIMVTAQAVSSKKLKSIEAPVLAKSEEFDVVGTNQNQSSSTSIQIINGKMTQSVTTTYLFYYTITAKKIGSFTFPSLRLLADGTEYTSNPFTIAIGKEPPQSAAEVKVSLSLNKKNLFVGEQAILTVQVAQKAGAQIQMTQQGLAELYDKVEKGLGKDFSFARLFSQLPSKGATQAINNENYFVVKVTYAVFPINAGELVIPSAPFQFITLRRAQVRRGGGSFFDDFFSDNFFSSGVEQVSKSVMSNSLVAHASGLPPSPGGFSGAVGTFKLNASISPQEVAAGEAATLSIAIAGGTRPGNIGDITLPQLPDCSIFSPEKHVNIDTAQTGISTHKTYKYLVIPKQEGTLRIPPLTWSYFDPISAAYKTLRTDTLNLSVTKGKGAPAVQSRYLTQEEIRQVGQDIRFIKTGITIKQQTVSPYKNPTFLLLYLLPLCIALFSLLYKIQSQRYAKDASLARRQKAFGRGLRKIADIHKKNLQSAPDVFLGKISECLEAYITEKFGFAATGKILGDLRTELVSHGVKEDAADAVVALFERMDVCRFGKGALDASSRTTILDKARECLQNLEKTRKDRPS
jgi:hypothetical protein